MYASFTSTSTSSVVRSAIVTTAPRVRPPPTDGATTSPISASFRSTVPEKGARITVFSRLAWAKRRRASAAWSRASAASARAAAWVARPSTLSRSCSATSSAFSLRMPPQPARLPREHLALGPRLRELGAGGAEIRLGLGRLGLVVGVLQQGDDLAPLDVGSLAHAEVGDPARQLGGDRRPGARDDVAVGRDARRAGSGSSAFRPADRGGRDDLHRNGAAAPQGEDPAQDERQRGQPEHDVAAQGAAEGGRWRVPVDAELGEIGGWGCHAAESRKDARESIVAAGNCYK